MVAKKLLTAEWQKVCDLARRCQACPLYRHATQTVFGEGSLTPQIAFVGEQPGDQEDRDGRPFVGPAGRLLDRALEEAGIDRGQCYVTNAVKHFKWEPRGKRRLHKKPNSAEIAACRPWLAQEIQLLQPECLVCLGVTAARAVFDRAITIKSVRGKLVQSDWSEHTLVTVHPSSLLRAPDPAARERDYAQFVADLRLLRDV